LRRRLSDGCRRSLEITTTAVISRNASADKIDVEPSITTTVVASVFVTCLSLMTAAVFYDTFHAHAGRLVQRWTKRPEGILLATTVVLAIPGIAVIELARILLRG
jgi:hypothetical protein